MQRPATAESVSPPEGQSVSPVNGSGAHPSAAEHQLATVEALAHIGSWQWETATDKVQWSDELFRIYGLEPGSVECTFHSYMGRVVEEDRERVGHTIQSTLESGSTFEFTERIRRPDGEIRTLRSRGRVVRDAEGQALRLIGTCQDVTEAVAAEERDAELAREQARRVWAEEQQRRTSFLAEATTVLAASLDYETTLRRLADTAVPAIADWCAIDVLADDGSIQRIAVAHPDPEKEELARELDRKYPPDPKAATGLPAVLRTGVAELVPEFSVEMLDSEGMDPEYLEIVGSLQLRSYMIVPLTVRGRVLGAITLVSAESGMSFDEDDLRFAQDLANRAAYSLENSRLYRESQRIQHQLGDRERQFRFLADSVPVQVWTAAPDGQLEYVNQRTERYFGAPSEELLGDQWTRFLHPEQIPGIVERWQHSLETGEPYEVEFLLRNGEDQYRWHLARAHAQADETGTIIRWFGSNTDIHAAKEAEAERNRLVAEREAERRRLLEVFEKAPAFIATLNGPDHVFESANPHYRQLVGDRELIGQPVAEALPETREQGFIDLLDKVYSTGEAFLGNEVPVYLNRVAGAEPELRYVNFTYQPMFDSGGGTYGIFVHGVDVTDLVEGRQQVEIKAAELTRTTLKLQATNQELDQFAYVASHDLKAPLRGIANLSRWIEEDLDGAVEGEVAEHLELLRGRVMRMEGLIDGILEYSRVGRVREAAVELDVGELVAGTVDLLAPEGVRVEISEDMPKLVTEPLPLRQVFMNLIGNAVKFASRGGSGLVQVTAEEQNDAFYRFSVKDNGPGIDPVYHERIFGIFQTLHARDEVEGTGIGLSLVKKIVENRGGEVSLESAEGEGATFHFTWPKNN